MMPTSLRILAAMSCLDLDRLCRAMKRSRLLLLCSSVSILAWS
ncbi:MAG: hypothetical protein ACK56F_13135 [bacterium]